MKGLTIPFFVAALMFSGCAKTPQPAATSMAEQDAQAHIPQDLKGCFAELKKVLKPEDVEKMKNGTEEDMIRYHFGLGMWMRNNWGLWGGSRLADWFYVRGIEHPDDMSGIILDSFWRHLNGKPIKLDEQIKSYQDFWKKQQRIRQGVEDDADNRTP